MRRCACLLFPELLRHSVAFRLFARVRTRAVSCDLVEVVRGDSPTNVTCQPAQPVGTCAAQAVVAPQNMNASLDPGAPPIASPPTPLVFVRSARPSYPPGPRNCHLMNANGLQLRFDTGCMKASVAHNQRGDMPKQPAVLLCRG
jgi:hypothetical protein